MSAEKAIAAASMVCLEETDQHAQGEVLLVTIVTDDGTGMDPRFQCEALWESVKDDWPGWEVAYCANAAANDLAAHRRLWECGIKDDNLMTERIEKYNAEVKARRAAA